MVRFASNSKFKQSLKQRLHFPDKERIAIMVRFPSNFEAENIIEKTFGFLDIKIRIQLSSDLL